MLSLSINRLCVSGFFLIFNLIHKFRAQVIVFRWNKDVFVLDDKNNENAKYNLTKTFADWGCC